MADSITTKQINKVIQIDLCDPKYKQDAGDRINGVDNTTCFAIPGSGLPPRHCNVKTYVTVAVASDMSVYISMHGDGEAAQHSISQKVFGQNYQCRIYVAPHFFKMHIPVGSNGWEQVYFTDNADKPMPSEEHPNDVAFCLTKGEVHKGYDKNTYLFDWRFGDRFDVQEGVKYGENELTVAMEFQSTHDGGFSKANSAFVPVGALTDYGWKREMGDSEDGYIYLCGGIVYDNATVTAAITADAVPIIIPGLNLTSFYYPGDIQKLERMSLNRPEGYFMIYDPDFQPEWLQDEKDGNWRPIKNTENDIAVERGQYDNTGWRLTTDDEDSWVRLIITGRGGVPDGEDINGEEPGIGADSDDRCCGCCPMKNG